MIPDAIKLITKVEVSNLNIFFIPLMKNDHNIYMVIALSVNTLNHLGIASQAFKSLVENFPILFLLFRNPAFYQNITVQISMLLAIKTRKPFDLRFSSLFQSFGLFLDLLIVKHSDIYFKYMFVELSITTHSNLFHHFKPQFIIPLNIIKQRQY